MSDGREWSGARGVVLYALLLAAAIVFFRIGAFSSLEMMDEGIVVYPSWRVAHGAVPYRDFQHIYAPGTFLLNGGLFAVFGENIAVIRWSLIALKAIVGALVFALASQVASRGAALLAWVVFVAVWGSPFWVFNNPYANHYGIALALTALLVVLGRRRPNRPTLIAVGLCVGTAALFKQTLGAFYAIALVLALFERPAASARGAAENLFRGLAALAAIGLYVSYVLPHFASMSTALLLAPALIAAVVLALRPPVAATDPGEATHRLGDVFAFATGAALPVLGCVAFYWAIGSLAILARDTVGELPHQFNWFVPLEMPAPRTWATFAAVASLIALVRPGATGGARRASAVVLAAATAAAVALPGSRWGWIGDFFNVLWWTPLVCVYGFAAPALRRGGTTAPLAHWRITALWLFAAAALLQLFPAADLPHVAMILPAFLPLVAVAVDRLVGTAAAGSSRLHAPAVAAVALLAAAILSPFAYVLATTTAARPRDAAGLERASRVWNPGERFAHVVDLVAFLRARGDDLFVVANQPLLYFLAARRSLFDTDDHVLYLVGTGLTSAENARRLVSEQHLLDIIARTRPLIVDDDSTPAGDRFRAAFPAVRDYIAQHYRLLRRFGSYQVWSWADGAGSAGGVSL